MTSYAPDVTQYPVIVGPRWTDADLFDVSSFQKAWDESLHPRGPDGKFIEGFGDVPADSLSQWLDTTGREWRSTIADIRSQGIGNCYQAAGTFLLNAHALGFRNPKVIHATVLGDGGNVKGVRFGHGWIEVDGPPDAGGRLVVDFSSGNSTIMPAKAYRLLGHVEDAHEYTEQEALDKLWETMNYGPWGWYPPNTGFLDKSKERWD